MSSPLRSRWPWWAAVLLTLGCQPEIGGACTTATDCGSTGDRLCDTTSPGGYCTMFNCEPGTCPEEAVCVAYHMDVSPEPACSSGHGGQRLTRSFCMARCTDSSDCRTSAGYACLEVSGVDPYGIEVVERGSPTTKICGLPWSGPPHPPEAEDAVCRAAPDASFPPPAVVGDAALSWPPVLEPSDAAARDASAVDGSPVDALPVDGWAAPGDATPLDGAAIGDAAPSDAAAGPSDAAAG